MPKIIHHVVREHSAARSHVHYYYYRARTKKCRKYSFLNFLSPRVASKESSFLLTGEFQNFDWIVLIRYGQSEITEVNSCHKYICLCICAHSQAVTERRLFNWKFCLTAGPKRDDIPKNSPNNLQDKLLSNDYDALTVHAAYSLAVTSVHYLCKEV